MGSNPATVPISFVTLGKLHNLSGLHFYHLKNEIHNFFLAPKILGGLSAQRIRLACEELGQQVAAPGAVWKLLWRHYMMAHKGPGPKLK